MRRGLCGAGSCSSSLLGTVVEVAGGEGWGGSVAKVVPAARCTAPSLPCRAHMGAPSRAASGRAPLSHVFCRRRPQHALFPAPHAPALRAAHCTLHGAPAIISKSDQVVRLARGQTLVCTHRPTTHPLAGSNASAMTSAASAARIPYKHSAAPAALTTTTTPTSHGQDPRCATSLPHARSQPDVAATAHDAADADIFVSSRLPPPTTTPSSPPPTTPTTADKVDSSTAKSSAPSVKSLRNHSRLASLGRIRSRGSIQQSVKKQPASPGETLPASVPVSPSDAGSHHKRIDGTSFSNHSSDSALSDDSKSEVKLLDAQPSRPSFWNRSPQHSSQGYDQAGFDENYKRLVAQRPRTMHQTSSKLLRMTEDDRPFTRVRVKSVISLQLSGVGLKTSSCCTSAHMSLTFSNN